MPTLKCGLGDIGTCGHPAIAVRMGLNVGGRESSGVSLNWGSM